MLPNNLIILGGGASVKEGIEKGLFNMLPNLFSIGLNYAYRYVNTTFNLGVDELFYNTYRNDIDKFPLYVGKSHNDIKLPGKNAYFFFPNKDYYRDLLPGIYSSTLAGLFSLSLGINLIEKGNIYLLGYDYGQLKDENGKGLLDKDGKILTHWYQGDILHRGIGKINWYSATIADAKTNFKRITNAEKEFKPYLNETDVKIYVVGKSNIPYFEHISYESFFIKMLSKTSIQDEIRNELKVKLISLRKQQEEFRRSPITYCVPPNLNIQNKKGLLQ